ncbi:hypothetical protein, partial [uncultured Microbacterium sp.]|uniref:hypothetical protein n=1 Tax=uncultured Microbacterium sp. TaxID=191216 RepID=UPI0025EA6290
MSQRREPERLDGTAVLFRAMAAVGRRGVWCRDDGYESGVLVQGEVPHDSVEGGGPVRDDG